jgi:protein-L-isoaspartate(D-aspartate) O-methyltransferase
MAALAVSMADFVELRRQMVAQQLVPRGIKDERVLAAMGEVPREAFVPARLADFAYDDGPLPIGDGQTISQPFIVAFMAEAATLRPDARVLEIGTGSGYAAAVLGRIARAVFRIERYASLAETARERLQLLGFDNVEVRHGDGIAGWPEAAPFEAILVAAGAGAVPTALKAQLALGGALVIPVGTGAWDQALLRLRRVADDRWEEEDLGAVAFVPLLPGSVTKS